MPIAMHIIESPLAFLFGCFGAVVRSKGRRTLLEQSCVGSCFGDMTYCSVAVGHAQIAAGVNGGSKQQVKAVKLRQAPCSYTCCRAVLQRLLDRTSVGQAAVKHLPVPNRYSMACRSVATAVCTAPIISRPYA
jgi:hypothetical protein